jgi:hypothetical protein
MLGRFEGRLAVHYRGKAIHDAEANSAQLIPDVKPANYYYCAMNESQY